MSARTFHIGEIITVAAGTFVSPTGMDGIYQLVDHVTGETHMTHQLPRASRELQPVLREWFPWLNTIQIPPISNEREGRAFLADVAVVHGEYHEVPTLPAGVYVAREPLAEFRAMNPTAQITPIILP